MLRLVLLAAAAAALQTRETVQRVVMVRTSGSDLAPAATGFIYKKDGGGPERVVEMHASEVEAQLSELYTRPADRVVPVDEHHDEHHGVADVDYRKIFEDYAPSYDDDYRNSYKRFKDKLYRTYGDGAQDDGAEKHSYEDGDAGSYHKAKFESYSISDGHKKDNDDEGAHKKRYDYYRDSGEVGRGASRDRDDETRGFRNIYDNSGHKDDFKYFGKGIKALADDDKYNRDDGGFEHHKHEIKQDDAKTEHGERAEAAAAEQRDEHSPAERAASDADGAGGGGGGRASNESFGYEVKH